MSRAGKVLTTGCDVPDLYSALETLVAQIPRGRVTTYGDVADALGNRVAARWVGEYLLDHPHESNCRCHCVLRKDGELGLYQSRVEGDKERLLRAEGIVVENGRVDLARFGWNAFQTSRPLTALTDFQHKLPQRLIIKPFPGVPELVGGVDVSYTAKREAVAAYALVETATGELCWSTTLRRRVNFPYISGYLAFREIPLLLELIDQVRREDKLAPLVFVDGNGMLHPRSAGIAVHFGVTTGIPTIGIGKKLLCGQVDLRDFPAGEQRFVTYQERTIGAAVKSTDKSRPVFASPGQFITVEDAARIAQTLFHGHRIPEPLYWADALSRKAAKEPPKKEI